MRSDSYPVSAHEAGHALTAYLVGGEAWIERKASGGVCGTRIPDASGNEEYWLVANLLTDASGLASESLLCAFDPSATLASAGDREEFFLGCKALRALGSSFVGKDDGLTWDLYVQVAKALLLNHDHVLRDLADQVENRGFLDSGAVERRLLWWKIRPIFALRVGDENVTGRGGRAAGAAGGALCQSRRPARGGGTGGGE
jgi:hypothetical protein